MAELKIPTFGIRETDDYVRKILTRAGSIPQGTAEEIAAFLTPHVMHQESRGNPRAVSPKGAVGTMQTMPATLRDPGFGVRPAADDSDAERERVGKDYLTAMVKRYPGRPDLALAAYNAGPGRADRWAKLGGYEPAQSPHATLGVDPNAALRGAAGTEALIGGVAPEWSDLEKASDQPQRGNFLSNVVGLDSSVAAIHRLWQDSGTEFDPNFRIGDLSEKEWEETTRGIPNEYWDGLASAGSRAHLQLLAQRLRAQAQAEQELAAYGGWGIAGRFALNMLDPLAVAIGIGTGGIGATTQAARIARAAAAARASGNFAEASAAVKTLESIAKGSKWRNTGLVATVAGVENAAFETLIMAGDTTRNGWDVAIAGITGGLLGAGASRVFNGLEFRRVQQAYLRERAALELDELNYKLDQRKAEVSARLAEVDNDVRVSDARAAVESIQKELAERASKAPQTPRTATSGTTRGDTEDAPEGATGAPEARSEGTVRERADDPLSVIADPAERTQFAERQAKASADLEAALGLQQARRGELEAELEGIEQARAAGVQASDRALMSEAADVFGTDTASAARFMGFDEGTHPHLDGVESGLPEISRMALAKAARVGPMSTLSGILRGNPHAEVRKFLGRLVGSATGNADRSASMVGASEHHARIHESMTAKFNTAVGPAYKEWAERNGIGIFGRQTRTARNEFMAQIGRHIKGEESEDPSVLKAASKVRPIFRDYLEQAKAAGVKGFENVEPNDNYLPRVFDFKRQHEIEKDIGSDNMRALVAGAIRSENEDVPQALADKIAAAYVKRMKELRVGSDAHMLQGVKWDDVGFLRRFLTESGLASDEVEDIVGKFAGINAARQRQTEGNFRYAKKRQNFDENFSMKFISQNAAKAGRTEEVTVRMSDLFENNVEALFGRYSRSVSGHIGLAKVGIKSRQDFQDSLEVAERAMADDLDGLKEVKTAADLAYKVITGQPVQDATALTRWGRLMRDYNFATTMNQVGFAQFPDLAGMLGKGYLGYTIRNFFDGFRMMRRTDGTLDVDFARELEEWTGLGTDFHNNAIFSSFDPGEENGFAGAFGKVEHGLRVAGRGTQALSGMAWITSFSQRLVGRNITQRLVKDVLEGGTINAHRSATLGLDDAMKARIADQIKKHTQFVDGDFGGKVRIVNYAGWDDVEARDTMLYAVFREARRQVQEEDLGDTSMWMHQNYGKIIAQFRRFALVSYSKQLLHGISHADAEEASRVMVSMVLAAAAYKARHEVALASMQAGGMDEADAQEYRERFLSDDRLFAAAYANSTYSSLLPALIDTATTYTVGERFFNTRTSGLGSDLVAGNPTVGQLNNLGLAAKGLGTTLLRGDRQFDQGDARAARKMLPFQNVYGLDGLFQALTHDLPERDDDSDPDNFQWVWED